MRELPNLNQIIEGETLYHYPTWKAAKGEASNDTENHPATVLTRNDLAKYRFQKRIADPLAQYTYFTEGEVYRASDGRRLVVGGLNVVSAVAYIPLDPTNPNVGKVVLQNNSQFRSDLSSYFYGDLAKRMAPLKKLVELEVALMLGIASAVSGPAGMMIMGVSFLEMIVNNRTYFDHLIKALRVCASSMPYIAQNAPTLAEKLSIGVGLNVLKQLVGVGTGIAKNTPQGIANNPKAAATATGQLIGYCTFVADQQNPELDKRWSGGNYRLSRMAVAKYLVTRALTIIAKSIPGAIGLTMEEKALEAAELVRNLRAQGVPISDPEAARIVDEISENPKQLEKYLHDINESVKLLI
ncbi:MAG: hypothetical protein V2J55_06575 [Candidatus Competibacteraceae bacterium]|nr:hypothetical protein [Candidatus Competibacteraceae bacterium]